MEAPSDPVDSSQQISKQKGGLRTMPFIIANEAFEKVASFGLLPNMILYLKGGYHMSTASGISILSLWGSASHFLPIVGAFISDSYMGRYPTIVIGCLVSLLGMILLWLTAMFPQARPPYCVINSPSCLSATPAQLTLLFASFVLMSVGSGGIRPCSMAFGADQLNNESNPNNKRVMQSFFNWYYASISVSIMIAITVIVYIQDRYGWKIGFGVPVSIMFVSTVFFVLATSLYVKAKPNKSMLSGFVQVTIAAVRSRHITLPPNTKDASYYHINGSNMVVPSEKLRFLNRACIIQEHEENLDSEEIASTLCTVEQVEDLKAFLKVVPLWSTGIMNAATISLQSLHVLQAGSMDRHLTSKFKIPAGSFGLFGIATLGIFVVIYDRLVIPQLAKITGKPYGIGLRERMGIGLVISCMAMATSAVVESIRLKNAIKQGFAKNPLGVLDMSAMWLVPQHCLGGLAEAFNAIAQIEFYYSQLPKSMSSLASALFSLSMAFGSLLVSVMVKIVDNLTRGGDKKSWVSNNINQGHYDYFYGLLTVMCGINLVYFIICCWAYGHVEGEGNMTQNEGEDIKE
ncbi:hypothetical protein ACHQM5_002140 [Ranunculus cassubicifolius]